MQVIIELNPSSHLFSGSCHGLVIFGIFCTFLLCDSYSRALLTSMLFIAVKFRLVQKCLGQVKLKRKS